MLNISNEEQDCWNTSIGIENEYKLKKDIEITKSETESGINIEGVTNVSVCKSMQNPNEVPFSALMSQRERIRSENYNFDMINEFNAEQTENFTRKPEEFDVDVENEITKQMYVNVIPIIRNEIKDVVDKVKNELLSNVKEITGSEEKREQEFKKQFSDLSEKIIEQAKSKLRNVYSKDDNEIIKNLYKEVKEIKESFRDDTSLHDEISKIKTKVTEKIGNSKF